MTPSLHVQADIAAFHSAAAWLNISRPPRVPRPPPLGELFLEMGIIVKPCGCPFSLSLPFPDPWEELTLHLRAIQVEAGGRGDHIRGRMGCVLSSISPHHWS